jgi:hypothetical protein
MQLLAVLPVVEMYLKLTLQPLQPTLQAMPTLMALPFNPKLLLLVPLQPPTHPRSGVMRTSIGGTHSSFVSISMAQ